MECLKVDEGSCDVNKFFEKKLPKKVVFFSRQMYTYMCAAKPSMRLPVEYFDMT